MIASLYAMKLVREAGIPLNKRIRVIMGCAEETGSQCMEHYMQVEEPVTVGFTPDGAFPGIYGEKSGMALMIRSKNTKPEERVRKELFSRGFRYRKNVRTLPGCPDIVLPKYRTVIFVNGCFWHKHDCGRFAWPSSNPTLSICEFELVEQVIRQLFWLAI